MQKKLASVLGSMSAFTLVVTAVCWAQDLAQPPKSPPIEQNLEDDLFTIPNCPHPAPMKCPVPKGTPFKEYCCSFDGGTYIWCPCGVNWTDWRKRRDGN